MNCQVDIDVVPCEDLPVVSPLFVSSDTSISDEDISAPLSEEEIVTAISELKSGKAPGMDEYPWRCSVLVEVRQFAG